MYKNRGFEREQEFVDALNDKRVEDLGENMHFVIKHMFDSFSEKDIVHCELVGRFQKPDVAVRINDVVKYVSLKSGRTTSIHEEYLTTFVPFLKEIGVSERNIKTFLRYIYCDGTTDGSGKYQYGFNELRIKYKDEIKQFNQDLLKNKEIIKKLVHRCIFQGSIASNTKADFIYFGTSKHGYLCTERQFFSHIDRRDWHFMENLHIGPLQFRVHFKGHSDNPFVEKRRHQCDVWWANLYEDMEYISERYDG